MQVQQRLFHVIQKFLGSCLGENLQTKSAVCTHWPGLLLPHLSKARSPVCTGDGSCFPLHYDSDESVDSRRITAILYLNPDWQSGDGGELKLYPWPHEPVTVEPLNNRLLLFSTCRMLHRSAYTIVLLLACLHPPCRSREHLVNLPYEMCLHALHSQRAWTHAQTDADMCTPGFCQQAGRGFASRHG